VLRDIYLRPIGLYAARRGDEADEVWGGLRLAGGWLDFTGLEVIERNGAAVERRVAGLGDVFERDWGRRTQFASDMLEKLREPRGRICGLAMDTPQIMGIVNVTPDSFSDGGQFDGADAAVAHGLALVEAGASVLDIGGESTRPGSDPVSETEELDRVIPVIERLHAETDVRISIDTRKAAVMRAAAEAGADIINDVSALTYDQAALRTVAELGLPVVLMHAQGDPKTMQDAPRYGDVLVDVFDYLEARVAACVAAGIPLKNLIVDPGIGFGKTLEHNLELMRGLSLFHAIGTPVMLGASRKRFLGTLTGRDVAADRVAASVATALSGIAQGTQFVRVHDVKETADAIKVWQAAW
jgi:dihydropteroate synthase